MLHFLLQLPRNEAVLLDIFRALDLEQIWQTALRDVPDLPTLIEPFLPKQE